MNHFIVICTDWYEKKNIHIVWAAGSIMITFTWLRVNTKITIMA